MCGVGSRAPGWSLFFMQIEPTDNKETVFFLRLFFLLMAYSFFPIFPFLIFVSLPRVCVCMCVYTNATTCLWRSEDKLAKCVFWGFDSGYWAWQQAPLSTGPSSWPSFGLLLHQIPTTLSLRTNWICVPVFSLKLVMAILDPVRFHRNITYSSLLFTKELPGLWPRLYRINTSSTHKCRIVFYFLKPSICSVKCEPFLCKALRVC